MPRQKGRAPQRLNAEARQSQQWNMGQDDIAPAAGSIMNIDLAEDTDTDDNEYVPSDDDDDIQYSVQPNNARTGNQSRPKVRMPIAGKVKRKPIKSKFKGNSQIDEYLQSLIDSATFFVSVKCISSNVVGEPSKPNKAQKPHLAPNKVSVS